MQKIPILKRESGRKFKLPRYHPHFDLVKNKANTLPTDNGVCRAQLIIGHMPIFSEQAPKGNASFSHISAHTCRRLSEIWPEHGLTSSQPSYYTVLYHIFIFFARAICAKKHQALGIEFV